MKKTISVVVPCYYEEQALPIFYKELCKIAEKMDYVDYEIVLVNDGSKDNTLTIMKQLGEQDKRVRYISFSRNFGKEAALYAGLKAASGDYVAIMDVDLQDPPELLECMYQSVITGEYDCVATRRVDRKGEPPIRSFFARRFYSIINKISNIEIVEGARDFRLMTRQMVDAILDMTEYNRFSKGIFGWVGFETKWLEYENVERVAGDTKWSFWKLFLYSIDGIIGYSVAPLAIATILGISFCLLAMIIIAVIIAKTIIFGDPVAGWPSLVCIILLIGGVQMFCTGILGEYLARTYLEVKKRPIFIIKESSEMSQTAKKNIA